MMKRVILIVAVGGFAGLAPAQKVYTPGVAPEGTFKN